MKATVFAPATVANVGPGFDLLGFAIDVAGDHVTVERTEDPGIRIVGVKGAVAELPSDPEKNTATVGLLQLQKDLGLKHGFAVTIRKGIPLGSGMGGSAASAVGGIVAANAVLDKPLPRKELLPYALLGEKAVSGGNHADNVAPCLFGGLVLARSGTDVTPIPVPPGILCVLVHPDVRIDTEMARKLLRKELTLNDHVAQSANLAGFLAGCYRGDLDLIQRSLADILIEPQRSQLIPDFAAVKAAALKAGALGCSISGSGPSIFAWAEAEFAEPVRAAMVKATNADIDAWVSPIRALGASVV